MEAFREAVDRCGLNDMGYYGRKFTWSNGRHGAAFTKERLDRAFCNNAWARLFNESRVNTLPATSSDHSPLWIEMEQLRLCSHRHQKPFRYEASWTLKEECFKTVEEAWNMSRVAANKTQHVVEGLKICQQKLTQWSKQQQGNFKREINEQMDHLSKLQDRNTGQLNEAIK